MALVEVTGMTSGLTPPAPPKTWEVVTLLAAIRPEALTKKTHPDMYVASQDYLTCKSLADRCYRFLVQAAPDVVVMELPSGGAQGARANRCMGAATAVAAVVELWVRTALPDVEFLARTPEDIKQATTGKRSGSKADVETAVRAYYNGQDALFDEVKKADREHVCDALAAVWAIRDTDAYRRAARKV